MAITLSVTPRGEPPEKARSVPIATMAVYDRHWAPAAHRLALQWVPLFRAGFPVQSADVSSILDELLTLRKTIAASGGEASEVVLPRIDLLVSELRTVDPTADIYIG